MPGLTAANSAAKGQKKLPASAGARLSALVSYSMIRKSGIRFSEKIMLYRRRPFRRSRGVTR
ncbi:MAG: hypothetical protein WBW35_12095, partial [Xanthobacteraceae bacterium]